MGNQKALDEILNFLSIVDPPSFLEIANSGNVEKSFLDWYYRGREYSISRAVSGNIPENRSPTDRDKVDKAGENHLPPILLLSHEEPLSDGIVRSSSYVFPDSVRSEIAHLEDIAAQVRVLKKHVILENARPDNVSKLSLDRSPLFVFHGIYREGEKNRWKVAIRPLKTSYEGSPKYVLADVAHLVKQKGRFSSRILDDLLFKAYLPLISSTLLSSYPPSKSFLSNLERWGLSYDDFFSSILGEVFENIADYSPNLVKGNLPEDAAMGMASFISQRVKWRAVDYLRKVTPFGRNIFNYLSLMSRLEDRIVAERDGFSPSDDEVEGGLREYLSLNGFSQRSQDNVLSEIGTFKNLLSSESLDDSPPSNTEVSKLNIIPSEDISGRLSEDDFVKIYHDFFNILTSRLATDSSVASPEGSSSDYPRYYTMLMFRNAPSFSSFVLLMRRFLPDVFVAYSSLAFARESYTDYLKEKGLMESPAGVLGFNVHQGTFSSSDCVPPEWLRTLSLARLSGINPLRIYDSLHDMSMTNAKFRDTVFADSFEEFKTYVDIYFPRDNFVEIFERVLPAEECASGEGSKARNGAAFTLRSVASLYGFSEANASRLLNTGFERLSSLVKRAFSPEEWSLFFLGYISNSFYLK